MRSLWCSKSIWKVIQKLPLFCPVGRVVLCSALAVSPIPLQVFKRKKDPHDCCPSLLPVLFLGEQNPSPLVAPGVLFSASPFLQTAVPSISHLTYWSCLSVPPPSYPQPYKLCQPHTDWETDRLCLMCNAAGDGTCRRRKLVQDGMSFCPQHWACLICLRGSAGNAVTDNVWVGEEKQRGKLRLAPGKLKSSVLLDEQRDGRQDRLRMGGIKMFCCFLFCSQGRLPSMIVMLAWSWAFLKGFYLNVICTWRKQRQS